MSTVKRYIGSLVERIEDLRFPRGRGICIEDLTCNGLLHAAILRSQVAHGRVRFIDMAAAAAMPGVHAVIMGADSAWFGAGGSRQMDAAFGRSSRVKP